MINDSVLGWETTNNTNTANVCSILIWGTEFCQSFSLQGRRWWRRNAKQASDERKITFLLCCHFVYLSADPLRSCWLEQDSRDAESGWKRGTQLKYEGFIHAKALTYLTYLDIERHDCKKIFMVTTVSFEKIDFTEIWGSSEQLWVSSNCCLCVFTLSTGLYAIPSVLDEPD